MFYGWRVVAGSFTTQLFVVGFFSYAVSLLVEPVRAEFGVSLEQVMYSLTAGTITGLFLQPVAGILVDKMSVRWIMSAGTLLYALGLYVLANAICFLASDESTFITGVVLPVDGGKTPQLHVPDWELTLDNRDVK